jgi:hypothetical protein
MARTYCISILLAFCLAAGAHSQNQGKPLSLTFEQMSLRAVCDTLIQRYGVPLVYVDSDLEGQSVTVRCEECSIEDFLSRILQSTRLTWRKTQSQYVLLRRLETRRTPSATISGAVRDSVTGESLAGAYVMLYPDSGGDISSSLVRVCPSNSYGFYSLRRVPAGLYRMVVRFVGYKHLSLQCTVTDSSSLQINPQMTQNQIAMQGVTIEGQRSVLSAADGISQGVFFRSTPSDQNQYLLDGARIYNPSHFGGVLSSFNTEALNAVQVSAGGIPPSYGGRIGGILDIAMREGTMERLSGSVGTGSLGSQLLLEGPLAVSTTFMISGRKGYPDILLPRIQTGGVPSTLNASEVIAKVSHRLSGSDRLFLSGYIGRDSYNNTVEGRRNGVHNDFTWGNASANLRWIGIASPSLFLHASAVYTRYDFTVTHNLRDDIFLGSTRLFSDYKVEDVTLRTHVEHYYDEEHTLRVGVELTRHSMSGTIDQYSSQIAQLRLNGSSSWEMSIYLQDQWQLLPRVMAELGARATSFSGNGGTFSAVDPRFSLLVSLNESWRIFSSLTAINQFVHPYRNSGIFLFYPTIFWYPSTQKVRPTHSLQVSLGTEKDFADNSFSVSAESYYRVTHDLHEFGFDTSLVLTRDFEDVILHGKGEVYGLELSLRKRSGSLTGAISYNFSKAMNEFAEINEGRPYTPRFSRRHELNMAVWYAPDDRWLFGVLGVLAADQSPSIEAKILVGGGFQPVEVIELNGNRLPGFQRLEFNVLHSFEWWGWQFQATLRLLNGYGLLDPYVWELRDDYDMRLKWKATLDEVKLFPLYPTVGLRVRF